MEFKSDKKLIFLVFSFFPIAGMCYKDEVFALTLKNGTHAPLRMKVVNSKILLCGKPQYNQATDTAYQKIHLSWHERTEDVQTIYFSLIQTKQQGKDPVEISFLLYRKLPLENQDESPKMLMHIMCMNTPRDFKSVDLSRPNAIDSAIELFVDGPHLDIAKIKAELSSE